MKYTQFLGSLALLATLGAAPLQAQVVGDPEVVANFLESYGLKVTRTQDQAGDPLLQSRVDETNFEVYFYDCQKGTCDSMQFSAGFDVAKPLAPATLNEWNRDKRFGKLYLDTKGNPHVEYDVNLDFDGVGAKNFNDTIDVWRVVLSEFRSYINW